MTPEARKKLVGIIFDRGDVSNAKGLYHPILSDSGSLYVYWSAGKARFTVFSRTSDTYASIDSKGNYVHVDDPEWFDRYLLWITEHPDNIGLRG